MNASALARSAAPPAASEDKAAVAVSVRDVDVVFGERENAVTALSGVSVDIPAGSLVTMLGPSGCGKSTLLRAIADLVPVSAGEITVLGRTPEQARRERNFSFVFQDATLLPWRSAIDNVRLPLEVGGGGSTHAEPAELLELVGLKGKEHSYPPQLSGGQQQRVGIGRAMAMDAELLLFDEPTSALDPEWVGEVLDLIRSIADGRQTMLIVTHEMQFAREIADRVVFMENGRIVEQGPPARIFDAPTDDRTRAFLRRVG